MKMEPAAPLPEFWQAYIHEFLHSPYLWFSAGCAVVLVALTAVKMFLDWD